MIGQPKSSVPAWFWIVAVVGLLWNLMGCGIFCMQAFFLEETIKDMSEPQKAWARGLPSWLYFVFGIAVVSSLAASMGMFMRKQWAVPLFLISLIAVLIQMVYSVFLSGMYEAMGPQGLVMPTIVTVLAVAQYWFSLFAKGKNWLA